MAQTAYSEIFDRFLARIEKDRDFFSYYNVPESEAQGIIIRRMDKYLKEAIDMFVSRCDADMDVDLYDFDDSIQSFNAELTQREIGILSNLMYEAHLNRDEMLIKAMEVRMTPTDLNRFSPANERSTFMSMLATVRRENEVDISKYSSRDRLTGKRKTIGYDVDE